MMHHLQRLLTISLLTVSCEQHAAPDATPTLEHNEGAEPIVEIPKAALSNGQLRLTRAQVVSHVPRVLTVSGRVEVSPHGASVLSAPTDARVTELLVEPGQHVERGQLIARLDAPAVAVARAELQRSEALRVRAERMVEQEQQLEKVRATSVRDSTLASQQLALASADYAAAEGNLRAWGAGKRGGANLVLRAPFAGTVSHVGVTAGSSVSAGRELVRLLKPEALSVLAWVPQVNANGIASGAATVIAVGHEAPCQGQVTGNLQRVDPQSGTIPYRVVVESCAIPLFEGAQVEVSLPLQSVETNSERWRVDADAVTSFEGGQIIFRRTGERTFLPIHVSDVEIISGQAYFRADGLEHSEVVVGGALLLKGELMKGQLE